MDGDELAFWVRFTDDSQGIYVAQLSQSSAVPEPSSFALLGLATGATIWRSRRRENRRAKQKRAEESRISLRRNNV
jgi:hypothetical protein